MKIGYKLVYIIILALISTLTFISCEDLTVKNITDKELVVIAPGDNLRTSFSTQTFWWEELDGAAAYNLQIVSPSFESVEILLADSILTKNKFTINLFPGRFEWRVKAVNGSFQTPFIVRSLQIDSTMDLKGQKVTLVSPGEDVYINSASTLFRWQKLYNADSYSIEVHSSSWSGELVYSSLSVINDTISVRKLSDGVYWWGIKAWNGNSATGFTTRLFTLDKTPPGIPSLSLPKDKANIQQLPVDLSWTRPTDTGSPVSDSLIISSDSLFRSGNTILAKLVQDSKYNNAVQDTGTYFWRVKSVDAAHNQGQFTTKRKFKVLNK
jgi:hypothetical protein